MKTLFGLDCEMSGLDPEKDKLLEIALVVTGPHLTPRKESPVWVIHQSDALLNGMDAWNKGTHGKSGLIDKVKASTLDEEQVQEQLIAFIKPFISKGVSPMCGNTISQDRRFWSSTCPNSKLGFTTAIWMSARSKNFPSDGNPRCMRLFKKRQSHTALADVHESIDELIHYREHFLKL
jgi:oligoribonuclease